MALDLQYTDSKIVYLASHALVVCTRNRNDRLRALLHKINKINGALPKVIIVVDSSDNFKKLDTSEFQNFDRHNFYHFRSASGLPFQRNLGINHIRNNFSHKIQYVTFLDDDVEIIGDYFLNAEKILQAHPEVVLAGGIDISQSDPGYSIFRKLVGLSSDKPGAITKSGFALVHQPVDYVNYVDWVPGYAQTYKYKVLEVHKFNGKLRMYGEDVEMHLRIGRIGKICTSTTLQVNHFSDSRGRDKIAEVIRYSDGFRWHIANQYPTRVNKFQVISSSFSLLVAEFFLVFSSRNLDHLMACLGHAWFLKDLLLRREMLQYIERDRWNDAGV